MSNLRRRLKALLLSAFWAWRSQPSQSGREPQLPQVTPVATGVAPATGI